MSHKSVSQEWRQLMFHKSVSQEWRQLMFSHRLAARLGTDPPVRRCGRPQHRASDAAHQSADPAGQPACIRLRPQDGTARRRRDTPVRRTKEMIQPRLTYLACHLFGGVGEIHGCWCCSSCSYKRRVQFQSWRAAHLQGLKKAFEWPTTLPSSFSPLPFVDLPLSFRRPPAASPPPSSLIDREMNSENSEGNDAPFEMLALEVPAPTPPHCAGWWRAGRLCSSCCPLCSPPQSTLLLLPCPALPSVAV